MSTLTSTVSWCSVLDRLPPEGEPCLVLCEDRVLMMGLVCVDFGVWVKYDHTDKRGCRQDFTHWTLYSGLTTDLK